MVSLYKLDLKLQQRYFVLELQNHTDVSLWLCGYVILSIGAFALGSFT